MKTFRLKNYAFFLIAFAINYAAAQTANITLTPYQSQGVKRTGLGPSQYFTDNTGEVEFDRGSPSYETKYRRYMFDHPNFLNSDITAITLNLTFNKTSQIYTMAPGIMGVYAPDITTNNGASWTSANQSVIDAINWGTSMFTMAVGTPNNGTTASQTNGYILNNLSALDQGDTQLTIGFFPAQDGITITGISIVVTYNVPPLANNTISGNQSIVCSGVPSTKTGSTPTGGTGTYSYQWQSSPNGTSNWTNISGATAMNYSPSGPVSSYIYYRRVVTSGPLTSNSNVITIAVNPPSTPTGLMVSSQTTSNLDLTWNSSTGATSYQVYECPNTYITTVTGLTYGTVSGLSPGSTHSYKVIAVCTAGSSAASSCVSGTTGLPISNNVICCNQTNIGMQNSSAFTGSQPTGGFGNYAFSWESSSTSTGPWSLISSATFGNYAPPNNLTQTTYYRRVVTDANIVGYSNVANITVTPPPTPLGLAVTPQSPTSLLLSWSASNGATGYKIYDCLLNTLITTINSPTTLTYLHTGLTPLTTYQYYIVAVCGQLVSPNSPCASGTTLPPPLTGNSICCNQTNIGYLPSNTKTGSTPSGGMGPDYVYQWEGSVNNINWAPISGANSQNYTPPSLTQTTYYRRGVTSGTQFIMSNVSSIIVQPVPAPTGLVVTTQSAYNLLLTWNASTNATSYEIYDCANNLVTTVNAPLTSCVIMGLTPSTSYQFNVVALSGPMVSSSSPCVSGVTAAVPVTEQISTYAGNSTNAYSGDGGFATQAGLIAFGTGGIYGDPNGNIYICDRNDHVIRKVDSTGVIRKVVGTLGTNGYAGDNGPANSALIDSPVGLVFDQSGNMYFADFGNNCIRKVDAVTQKITTFAGIGTPGYAGDNGPAALAMINMPTAMAIDQSGNIYFMDQGNFVVRKIDISGIITTAVGNGVNGYAGDNGPPIGASIGYITGLATKGQELYLCDYVNHVVRSANFNFNVIITYAGIGTPGYTGDGGLATLAQLNNPLGICFDGVGDLCITDNSNNVIRKIDNNNIFTYAGTGTMGFSGDGGQPLNADLASPSAIYYDQNALYFIDAFNYRARIIYGYCYSNAGPTVKNMGGCCGGCIGVLIGSQALTGLTYAWSPISNLSCNTCNQPLSSACNINIPTTYNVTVSGNYCSTKQAAVTVKAVPYTGISCCRPAQITGVENADLPPKNEVFSVFPNPSNGHITVLIYDKADYMRVMDILGKTIYVINDVNEEEINIDISAYPKGIYFVTAKIGEKLEKRKIIIE